MKVMIAKILRRFGYIILREGDPAMDRDGEFAEIFRKCKDYSLTSKERMYALYKAVQYIIHADIPGDFVESGVWRGGSAMVIAYTLQSLGVHDRTIYLYDTFAGMPKPTDKDFRLADTKYAIEEWEKVQKRNENMTYASLEEVQHNMHSTGYPKEHMMFVEGPVEETIPSTLPMQIALLRLDTDWYSSTKHELTHLFPLVTKHGVLIIDDYGHFSGAKKATDEYFSGKPILLHRIDYSGRMGIKIS